MYPKALTYTYTPSKAWNKVQKATGGKNEKRKEKERKVCGKYYPKILTMISFLNKIFCVCLPARPNLW